MHQDAFDSIRIMISKIISRAACLTELASNSKSFSNCPDLHGGAPDLPGDRIWMKPALGKEKVVPLPWIKDFGPVADRRVSGKLFFRPEQNNLTLTSLIKPGSENNSS
jgi:hypothetical protein